MRTGIPPQYMKQINGKIEIHIRDMGTPTWPPPPLPSQAVKLILSSGESCRASEGVTQTTCYFFGVCYI